MFLILFFYGAFAFGQGKVLFEDDFSNNRKEWRLRNDKDFRVSIKNGVFRLEKHEKNRIRNGCLWYAREIPGFNTLNNFSIILQARFVSGGDIIDNIDLQWGKQRINGNNKINPELYKISVWNVGLAHLDFFNSSWSYFVRKDIKQYLGADFNPAIFNKYEFIQKDGFVLLKINNKEVLRHQTKAIPGNTIGFQQCLKSVWEIDKITVRQQKPIQKAAKIDSVPLLLSDVGFTFRSDTISSQDHDFKVFPNPFENTLNANFRLSKEQTVMIFLIDMKGTVLQQHTKKMMAGTQTFTLFTDIAPGSYILKVQKTDGSVLSSTVIRR